VIYPLSVIGIDLTGWTTVFVGSCPTSNDLACVQGPGLFLMKRTMWWVSLDSRDLGSFTKSDVIRSSTATNSWSRGYLGAIIPLPGKPPSSCLDPVATPLILPRPSLIPDLFAAINQGFSTCYGPTPVEGPPFLRLKRSLQVLNAILKEFSAIKMPSGIRALGTVGYPSASPLPSSH
jgi:hypothetical protein